MDMAVSWIRKTWPMWAIVLGLHGWFIFANSMSRAVPLLCYPSIAIIGAGITAHCLRRFTWRWTKLIGIVLTVAAVYLWGRYDTYTTEWTKDNTRYTDTYKRWSHHHVYRKVESFETVEDAKKGFGLPEWSARGPIAGTGKLHGEWNYTYWKPKLDFDTRFYWYGDEVSEGEWHLRNQ